LDLAASGFHFHPTFDPFCVYLILGSEGPAARWEAADLDAADRLPRLSLSRGALQPIFRCTSIQI
jgi:hypothetical protein